MSMLWKDSQEKRDRHKSDRKLVGRREGGRENRRQVERQKQIERQKEDGTGAEKEIV